MEDLLENFSKHINKLISSKLGSKIRNLARAKSSYKTDEDYAKLESNIQLLEAFNEKKHLDIFLKYLNECGGDIFTLLTHFTKGSGFGPLIKLKIYQLFSFKTKLFDNNQKQITIETGPLIYSSNDTILFGNEITFSKNIEFEVNQTINDLNDNKEIAINLIEKK